MIFLLFMKNGHSFRTSCYTDPDETTQKCPNGLVSSTASYYEKWNVSQMNFQLLKRKKNRGRDTCMTKGLNVGFSFQLWFEVWASLFRASEWYYGSQLHFLSSKHWADQKKTEKKMKGWSWLALSSSYLHRGVLYSGISLEDRLYSTIYNS